MVDLRDLRQRILHDPDLYRGVRAMSPFPVPREVSEVFMRLARMIIRLYPERVSEPLVTSYDARIIVMEFCDDHRTSCTDLMRVLDNLTENS